MSSSLRLQTYRNHVHFGIHGQNLRIDIITMTLGAALSQTKWKLCQAMIWLLVVPSSHDQNQCTALRTGTSIKPMSSFTLVLALAMHTRAHDHCSLVSKLSCTCRADKCLLQAGLGCLFGSLYHLCLCTSCVFLMCMQGP